jgi:hypothetical protein
MKSFAIGQNVILNKVMAPSVASWLYYKPMTILNDDSRVINKLETSLTDDARAIIYNCHMFIVQATGVNVIKKIPSSLMARPNKL